MLQDQDRPVLPQLEAIKSVSDLNMEHPKTDHLKAVYDLNLDHLEAVYDLNRDHLKAVYDLNLGHDDFFFQ